MQHMCGGAWVDVSETRFEVPVGHLLLSVGVHVVNLYVCVIDAVEVSCWVRSELQLGFVRFQDGYIS